jgi:glycosyltransferase involved in cell wall biosynthesis
MKTIKQPELFLKLAVKIGNKAGITFLMIGRPPNRIQQKAFFEKIDTIPHLIYLGEIPNDKVNEYLCRSHIFVSTSLAEGFSNTFIQSWMRRLPVVSLNVDPDNIIKNEGIGFHSGCFEQMVEDVKKLIKDHRLRKILGNKAHKYATKNYSLQNIKKVADIIVS